jgi:hypothetical protein
MQNLYRGVVSADALGGGGGGGQKWKEKEDKREIK